MRPGVFVAMLAACSSGKPKPAVDETPEAHARGDAGAARDAAAAPVAVPSGPYRVDKGPNSDVQVRVEWKDVPLAARASPGRTACGTPKPGAVAPTVTWGIPEVVVVLATDHGKAMQAPAARVVFDRCAVVPRVALAGDSVTIASAADQPASIALVEEGKVDDPQQLAAGTSRTVMLPVAGHEVSAALHPGSIYRLGEEPDAWIVSLAQPYAGITDGTGTVVLRDVPLGTYGVLAWLPPRAGQAARLARGQVTVTAGALAEVTLDLTQP